MVPFALTIIKRNSDFLYKPVGLHIWEDFAVILEHNLNMFCDWDGKNSVISSRAHVRGGAVAPPSFGDFQNANMISDYQWVTLENPFSTRYLYYNVVL